MLEPASDLLPDAVATALGISAKATISSGPQGMTSEVAFVDDQGRQSVLKRCRDVAAFYEGYGGEQVDTETRRWFVGLYEFF